MYVQLALVCDEARVRPDGKMDIEGIFNDLAAPGFPAKQERMVLITTVCSRPVYCDPAPVTVDGVAPGGRRVV
jgi:hypothetical protein